MGIFFQSFASSDFFGKLIFLALFALSFISWYVLLQKVLLIREVKRKSNKLQEWIQEKKQQVLSIPVEHLPVGTKEESGGPFVQIYQVIKERTLEILDKNHFFHHQNKTANSEVFLSRSDLDLIDNYTSITITNESKKLEKNLFILSTVVSLAPFLGILGTVWGILISLGELQKGGAVHSNSIVLGGISTALATTVLGLVIAIPALIAYNYLRSALRHFHTDMEDFSHLLLSTIEMQYRKVDAFQ